MEITLKNLHDAEFGSIDSLVIDLPVFRPENLKVPPILTDKGAVDAFLNGNLKRMRTLAEELDDDSLLVKMHSRLVHVSFLDRTLEPSTPVHDFVFQADCGNFAGGSPDDVNELVEEVGLEVGYKQFVQRLPLLKRFMHNRGSDEEIEALKGMGLAEMDQLSHILPGAMGRYLLLREVAKELHKTIPDIEERLKEFRSQGIRTGVAYVLNLDPDVYSEETTEEILSLTSNGLNSVELLAGLRDLKVDSKIRETYLFQRVHNRFCFALTGLDNLVTLQADLEEGNKQKFNTIIKRAKKLSLQTAVESRVNDLRGQLNDIQVIIRKLEKTYPLDENLSEYLEILQDVWDAELMMILHSPEYEYLQPKLKN